MDFLTIAYTLLISVVGVVVIVVVVVALWWGKYRWCSHCRNFSLVHLRKQERQQVLVNGGAVWKVVPVISVKCKTPGCPRPPVVQEGSPR